MSTTYLEVTLKQMLQMALGVPKITRINLSILHSFFDIILRKLGAQYEKVKIVNFADFDAACFAKVLRCSRVSPLPFNEDNVQQLANDFRKAQRLELKLKVINNLLKAHFEDIQKFNHTRDSLYDFHKWERFCMPTENLCQLLDPESLIRCKLLNSNHFIEKISQSFVEPLMIHLAALPDKIETIHADMLDWKRVMRKNFKKIKVIEDILKSLECMRSNVGRLGKMRKKLVLELENMLIAKVNKLHVNALKRFVTTRESEVKNIFLRLKKKELCRSERGIKATSDNRKCLSCQRIVHPVKRPFHVYSEKKTIVKFTDKKLTCAEVPTSLTQTRKKHYKMNTCNETQLERSEFTEVS